MRKLKSILLVDDDEATNFIHSLLLKEWDCVENIYTAMNGQEALDFLKTNEEFRVGKPSIILLDINMPVMNGFEFLEAYADLPEEFKASIVVCMLTSSLHQKDQDKASGFSDLNNFINKPLDKEAFDQIVASIEEEHPQLGM